MWPTCQYALALTPYPPRRFCTPTMPGGIHEISLAPPRPVAVARARPGLPLEFSTCFFLTQRTQTLTPRKSSAPGIRPRTCARMVVEVAPCISFFFDEKKRTLNLKVIVKGVVRKIFANESLPKNCVYFLHKQHGRLS